MRAERIAQALLPPSTHLRQLPGVGWLGLTKRPDVVVLDQLLVERVRFPVPSTWWGNHWVTPDLAHVVVSERDRILLIDRQGRTVWETRHAEWGTQGSDCGSCWVTPDGAHVLATVPTIGGTDAWWVLDRASGRVLATCPLQCHSGGSHPVPHPDGKHVGLCVGEGQDGAEVYWGRWEDQCLDVTRLDDRTRFLIDVHPKGTTYLTTPHHDGILMVHDFPSGRALARLASADVFPTGERFDYMAGYLSEELILAGSHRTSISLLLTADTLAPVGEVTYPPDAPKECIIATGRGTWLTSSFVNGQYDLWRLADDA